MTLGYAHRGVNNMQVLFTVILSIIRGGSDAPRDEMDIFPWAALITRGMQ